MKHIRKNKIAIFLTGLLFLLLCIPQSIFARENIQIEKKASLTISSDIEGAVFRLYKIGNVTQDAKIELLKPFSEYGITLGEDVLDKQNWEAMARTIAGYVERDNLDAVREGSMEKKLVFDQLECGIYLVTGKNPGYVFLPFLVSLPTLDENGMWNYILTAVPKYEKENIPEPGPEEITVDAVKIWKDSGREENRPAQIVLQLLKNGEIYEEAVLNSENNWRYSWSGLFSDAQWTVVEKEVAEGYTVTVEQNGYTFGVTNTYHEEPEPTPEVSVTPSPTPEVSVTPSPTPEVSVTPSPTPEVSVVPSPTPEVSVTPSPTPEVSVVPSPTPEANATPSPTPAESPEKLPQTGQLWWPVPFLAMAGILLIIIGIAIKKKQ